MSVPRRRACALLAVVLAAGWGVSPAAAGPGTPGAASPFGNWQRGLGNWSVNGEVYRQGRMLADCRSFAPAADWTDYVYEVKARKTGGGEGFLILFRVQDKDHFYWWNVAGWGNSRHAVETRPRGPLQDPKSGRIEIGRWYDIRIELKGDSIRCYLDGKLVHDIRDKTFPRGGIGLGSWNTAVEYKDVRVTGLDGRKLYGGSGKERARVLLGGLGPAAEELRKRYDAMEAGGAGPDDPRWEKLHAEAAAARDRLAAARERLAVVDPAAERRQFEKLLARFPQAAEQAQAYLRKLEAQEKRLAELKAAVARGEGVDFRQADAAADLLKEVAAFRRGLWLPRCPKIAFLKRQAGGRRGTNATMHGRMTGVGSAICVYDPARPDQPAKTIFEDPEGFIFDMNPSYEADKLLFAYKKDVRNRTDSFHIYEIHIDGTGLRQLTTGRYHDFSPIYLPDPNGAGGRIVFNSTRVESYSLCQDFIACSLFVMNGDGSDIRRIEYNTLCALTPYVMDDGSILFTRWEYQDKNIFCTEALWTLAPDGTRLALFYGNTLTIPNAIYGAKQVPGTDKILCVMAAHHFPPLGGIALIDRRAGLESPEAMTVLTPDVPYRPTVGATWRDINWGPGDKFYPWSYTDPWPIAEDLFVVSYGGPMEGGPKRYRLYLMDDRGDKMPLYDDPTTSCYNPVPLMPRPRPHRLPGNAPPEPKGEGVFLVSDVYQGLLGKGVERGDVKALRICSQTPKKYNTEGPRYHDHYPIIGYGSYYVKLSYGTVPVTPEGMAYFRAPAGVELYFEALDATGKEIRRMGTVTQLADGEVQGCIGCHESRFLAAPTNPAAMDRLRKPPDTITPPSWGAVPIDFVRHVQPVFDRHCVRCHSGRAPKAGMDLSGDGNRFFNMAYKSLIDRGLVDFYYINPGPTGNFPPLVSGSRVSRLVKQIESGHQKIQLDHDSLQRIYTWIDLNCNYYSTWDMSRPHSQGGRDTWAEQKGSRWVRAGWVDDLHRAVQRAGCADCHGGKGKQPQIADTWVNLTRPELSRLLNAHLSTAAGGMAIDKPRDGKKAPIWPDTSHPDYQAMLKAIEAGKAALLAKPRMDMPGAVPIPQQRDFGRTY